MQQLTVPREEVARQTVLPTERLRYGNELRVAAGYLASVGILAYLYGLVPLRGRAVPLVTLVGIEGWVNCLDDGLQPCPYLGYPEGIRLSLSTSPILGSRLLGLFGISTPSAVNLIAIGCLAVGLAALWYLTYRLTSTHLASVLAVALYFGSPMLIGHIGLVSIFLGFLVLPVPVLVAYLAVVHSRSARALCLLALSLLIVGILTIFSDPYPYIVATACVAIVLGTGIVFAVVHRRWTPAVGLLGVLTAACLPALLFRLFQSGGGLEIVMPLDFYRAVGADVGTMVVPTESQILGRYLPMTVKRWSPQEFHGTYTRISAVWLGPIFLVVATIGAIVLFRQRRSRWFAIGLGLIASCCFILGLGPSFKWIDRADRPVNVDFSRLNDDYLMTSDQATFAFPWAGIYGRQPFASMRYTYRWQVGLRLATVVFAAAAVASLAERRKVLATALSALLVLEATPWSLLNRPDDAANDSLQYGQFHSEVDGLFAGGALAERERVLFLPTSNDYLMQVIASKYRLLAYNIAFDKELARIQPLQPSAVTDAERAYEDGTLTRDAVCRLFQDDLLDALVFTEFHPRWNAYRWPSAPNERDALRARYVGVGLEGDPAFDIDDRDLAVVVRAASGRTCEPAVPGGT